MRGARIINSRWGGEAIKKGDGGVVCARKGGSAIVQGIPLWGETTFALLHPRQRIPIQWDGTTAGVKLGEYISSNLGPEYIFSVFLQMGSIGGCSTRKISIQLWNNSTHLTRLVLFFSLALSSNGNPISWTRLDKSRFHCESSDMTSLGTASTALSAIPNLLRSAQKMKGRKCVLLPSKFSPWRIKSERCSFANQWWTAECMACICRLPRLN